MNKKILLFLLLALCGCNSVQNNPNLIFNTAKMDVYDLPLVDKLDNYPLTSMHPEIHEFKIDYEFVAYELLDNNHMYGIIKKSDNSYALGYYNFNNKHLVEIKEYPFQYMEILDANEKYVIYYGFQEHQGALNDIVNYYVYNIESDQITKLKSQTNMDLGLIMDIQSAILADDILYLNYYQSDSKKHVNDQFVVSSFDLNNNQEDIIDDRQACYVELIGNKLYYLKYDDKISQLMEYDIDRKTMKVLGQASSQKNGVIDKIYEVYGKLIVEIGSDSRKAIYRLDNDNNKLVEMFAINSSSLVAFKESNRYFITYMKDRNDIISYIWDLRTNKLYQGKTNNLINYGECLVYTTKSEDKMIWHYLVNAPYEGKGTYISDKNEKIYYDFDVIDGGVDFGNGVKLN